MFGAPPNPEADSATIAVANRCEFVQSLVDSESSIAVDYGHLILGEYYTNLSQQFDSYVILTELMAQGKVLQKHIAIVDGVAKLPNEIERTVQDEDDRKFVAVSLAFLPMPPPPIVNATDSDWAKCEQGLSEHGVEVIQLCPELCQPVLRHFA